MALLLLVCSCQGQREQREVTNLVYDWQGREVLFPYNVAFTSYVRDTVNYDAFAAPFRVLHYVDTSGCFSCKLRIQQWRGLIEELNVLEPGKVSFLLCLSPGRTTEALDKLESVLYNNVFDHPVWIDRNDSLNVLNRFPKRNGFQTFLLDSNNRVVAIGNPVNNERVKALYLDYLTGKRSPEPLGITKVSVSPVNVLAGSLKQGEDIQHQNKEPWPLGV